MLVSWYHDIHDIVQHWHWPTCILMGSARSLRTLNISAHLIHPGPDYMFRNDTTFRKVQQRKYKIIVNTNSWLLLQWSGHQWGRDPSPRGHAGWDAGGRGLGKACLQDVVWHDHPHSAATHVQTAESHQGKPGNVTVDIWFEKSINVSHKYGLAIKKEFSKDILAIIGLIFMGKWAVFTHFYGQNLLIWNN